MTRFNRSLRCAPLVVLLSTLAVAAPAGAVDFGVRAGAVVDDSDPFVGLEVLAPLGRSGWFANPNVEFVDRGERDRVSFNADFHYDLRTDTDFYLWGGAGAAAIHTDGDPRHDSQTDLGLNLLAGIGWKLPDVTPYAQVKLVVSDDSSLFAGVGIRF